MNYDKNNIKAVCAFTAWAACVLFDIEYGTNDKAICAWMNGDDIGHVTRNTIQHTGNGDAYITKYGHRFYLNEFIRV